MLTSTKIAPSLFEKYPNLEQLANATLESLYPLVSKVRNFNTKSGWLIEIAQTLKNEDNIPITISELTALKGIGRKSANLIMRVINVPLKAL